MGRGRGREREPPGPRAPTTSRGAMALVISLGVFVTCGMVALSFRGFGAAEGGSSGAASLTGIGLAIAAVATIPGTVIAHSHEAAYRAFLAREWCPAVRRSELQIVAAWLTGVLGAVAVASLLAASLLAEIGRHSR